MPRKPANCYIIAGPNGAGKTTFATEFLPLYVNCRNFINPDLLARAFSPFDPDAGMFQAGRAVLERIAQFTEAHVDFAFETTLAGRSYVSLLRQVKKAGFELHLFYLWIPSPDLALLRIRDRVENGGHNVPEERMCDGALGARSAICSRFIVRCWIRCTFSTTRPTHHIWCLKMRRTRLSSMTLWFMNG